MDPIFEAAANPLRIMEIRVWMGQNPQKSKTVRGKHGESLLHWMSMTDIGLTIDLMNLGLEPNLKDDDDRTPLDWMSDRIHYACLDPKHRQSLKVRQTLKNLTEQVGLVFIPRGATGNNTIETWARVGLWDLIQAEMERDGEMIYIKKKDFSPLHFFPIAAFENDGEVMDFMEKALKYGLDINYENKDGFTPLMVGVEQWLLGYVPDKRLSYMVEMGADIDIENNFGQSCLDIVYRKDPKKVLELQKILNLK